MAAAKQKEVREAEQQHTTTTAWQREEQVNRKKKKRSKLSSKKERIWTKNVKAQAKDISKKIKQGFRDNKRTKKNTTQCREFSSSSKESKRKKMARQERDFLSRA